MTDKGYLHRRSENFGKMPEPLMHDPTVTDGAKVMYSHMHWRYGSDCQNFEGRVSMADMLDISETAVTDRITELAERDWVVVVTRSNGRGRATNFYHVFEYQADCIAWRQEHKVAKPSLKLNADGTRKFARKSRRGVGGKPSHKVDDSIPTQVGQGISTQVDQPKINSSSRPYPDSVSDTDVSSISQPAKAVASEPESVQIFKPALEETPKRKRKPKTPTDPFFVFEPVEGKSVYTGPFKDLAKAQRHAAGHGTVTQQQAIPPGATTRPVPKPVQPWDVLAKALARTFFQATDEAAVNAVYGRIAPILHGDKRGGRCIGVIEYECQRQKIGRDKLDYDALAAFVPVVWAYYQAKNPGTTLKDCAKILDYWQARRVLDIPAASQVGTAHFEEVRGPNPYNPNPNLVTTRLVNS